jgi:hypothetical protein
MDDTERTDLVDVFYAPFVRALGNLVITFAQSESALLELVTELVGGDENAASAIFKVPDYKEKISALIESSEIQGFELSELVEKLALYWCDKDVRNRYTHDEWFVGIDVDSEPMAVPGTRGIPRKKGSTVVFNRPTPDDIWTLAGKFREHDNLFSYTTYALRKKRVT